MIDEKYKTALLGVDSWFDKYHSHKLSGDFCEWWLSLHGQPSHDGENLAVKNKRYYVKMMACLKSWNAAKNATV